MITKTTIEIFVDLDRVLADFDAGMKHIIYQTYGDELDHSEERYDRCRKYRQQVWHAFAQYQEGGGQLWYELELLEDAMELWEYVKPYKPQILSATGKPSWGAEEQKRLWVAERFGDDVVVNLTRTAADKASYASEGAFLIDDKLKAIIPWAQNGGTGILHTSAQDSIDQLKKFGI